MADIVDWRNICSALLYYSIPSYTAESEKPKSSSECELGSANDKHM